MVLLISCYKDEQNFIRDKYKTIYSEAKHRGTYTQTLTFRNDTIIAFTFPEHADFEYNAKEKLLKVKYKRVGNLYTDFFHYFLKTDNEILEYEVYSGDTTLVGKSIIQNNRIIAHCDLRINENFMRYEYDEKDLIVAYVDSNVSSPQGNIQRVTYHDEFYGNYSKYYEKSDFSSFHSLIPLKINILAQYYGLSMKFKSIKQVEYSDVLNRIYKREFEYYFDNSNSLVSVTEFVSERNTKSKIDSLVYRFVSY